MLIDDALVELDHRDGKRVKVFISEKSLPMSSLVISAPVLVTNCAASVIMASEIKRTISGAGVLTRLVGMLPLPGVSAFALSAALPWQSSEPSVV